jgi:CRP-like cAMP-binding protein
MSPSTDAARPERNRLLARLPPAEYELLAPHLTEVSIAHRQALMSRGQPITAVHFPRGAVASVLVTMDDGAAVEGATIGDEGMIGLAAFLDDGSSIDDAVCQVPGPAARLDVREFRSIAERSLVFQHVLRRYTLALMGQITRTAGCNRVHPVEERLARWLLMTQDRVGAAEFPLTHDYIAAMLGVRRPSVTVVAGVLQQAGLIEYRRGRIRILDREGLQEAACEDYRLTEEIYERLFREPG